MKIELAKEHDGPEWDALARRLGAGHHAYSWAWRGIISEAFGHTPYYFLARGGNGAAGLLPMFLVNSVLFGKALISVPYLNAGGILAESPEAFNALLNEAVRTGKDTGSHYIELRHTAPTGRESPDLQERTHKVTMHLELSGSAEALFESFPPKLRSQIRRPTKSGISAKISGETFNESESEAFYSVFSENMRDLGTPVYPKKLFPLTKKGFGASCRVITVWQENKPVAGGLTVGFGNAAEILWASSLRQYNKNSPNMLLYWEAIKTACADGYKIFDFGRSSPDSGTFKFKQQWGAEPQALFWYYRLFEGDLPDVNPKSPKFSFLVNCWKRLPLPVANCLGPWLTRSLP